jgi:hypothetical protein
MDTKPLFPRDQTPEPLDTQGLRDELERMKQQRVDYKDEIKPERKRSKDRGIRFRDGRIEAFQKVHTPQIPSFPTWE